MYQYIPGTVTVLRGDISSQTNYASDSFREGNVTVRFPPTRGGGSGCYTSSSCWSDRCTIMAGTGTFLPSS